LIDKAVESLRGSLSLEKLLWNGENARGIDYGLKAVDGNEELILKNQETDEYNSNTEG
jgi:hypothetical protein